MFIPIKVIRGKHYAVYKNSKGTVKTKASLLKEALKLAKKENQHAEWIDFIPCKFTLQLHGWLNPKSDLKNLKEVQDVVKNALKTGKDPLKEVDSHKAKCHYDLRIKKRSSATWFGLTGFRAFWTGIPENKVMGCSDDKTFIFTDSGWKLFKDLTFKDKVAQVDPKTRILSFVKPLKICSFNYDGELIGVEQQHVNFMVTPGHRLFVSPHYWVKTGDKYFERRWNNKYERKFKIRTAANVYGQTCHFSREVKWEGKKVNNKWFEFLGFWFAEGSVYSTKRAGSWIQVVQKTKVDYARNLIKSNFKEWNEFLRKDGLVCWRIYDQKLVREFLKYKVGKKGLRGRKQIPAYVFEADRKGLRAFIHGYFMGDGSGKRNHGRVLFTVFKPLALQFERLLIQAGYSVNISTKSSGKGSLIYQISYSENKGLFPKVRSNHWVTKYYKGKVYSVSVPSGLVLTRRNGIYQITGNTVKGYQVIAPGGKHLEKFLAEEAERQMAREGIAERRDRIEWMKVKAQWFPPFSPGNPTRRENSFMLAIEFWEPACLHRRELDFFDITFFGKYLKGRYFNRLVERKMKSEELAEWQKKAIKSGKAKAFYNLSFYFWKAKAQWGDKGTPYSMEDVRRAALGKKTLDKIPAPPQKK